MSCLASAPTATSHIHRTHTLTFLHPSPSLLGPSTQRIHALSSKNSSVLSHATGDHIVFQHQMTDQQPLRSDIYIRLRPSVTSRGSLQPTPRPWPPPPSSHAVRPDQPAAGRPSGGSDVRPRPCSPTRYVWDPARSAACLTFCRAQPRSGGRLKPVRTFCK